MICYMHTYIPRKVNNVMVKEAQKRIEYLDQKYRKSNSEYSRNIAKFSLDNFDHYCEAKFHCSTGRVIERIKQDKLDVYIVLNGFVEYLQTKERRDTTQRRGVDGTTIHTYMNRLVDYFGFLDIEVKPHRFKNKVSMPKKLRRKKHHLTMEVVRNILRILPPRLQLLCMLILTTLRRPNELLHLRVKDIHFDSTPVGVTIRAEWSKNEMEEDTFTTSECAEMLRNHRDNNNLKDDDYIFGDIAKSKWAVMDVSNNFRYNMKKYLPNLVEKIEGSIRNKIKPYSFKVVGFSIIEKRFGTAFANHLKGDKNSEYSTTDLGEIMNMYLEVEPLLTVFNAEQISKQANLKYTEVQKELEEIRKERQSIQESIAEFKRIKDFVLLCIPESVGKPQIIREVEQTLKVIDTRSKQQT